MFSLVSSKFLAMRNIMLYSVNEVNTFNYKEKKVYGTSACVGGGRLNPCPECLLQVCPKFIYTKY